MRLGHGIGITSHRRAGASGTAQAPTITGLSGTGSSYTLTVSAAATLYILVNTSATVLSGSAIKSAVQGTTGGVGYATQAVTTGSNGFSVTFTATAGTTYYIHVAAEASGAISTTGSVTSYTEPAAGVSFVAAQFTNGSTNAPSITVNLPTNLAGDMMVVAVMRRQDKTPTTGPAGWTKSLAATGANSTSPDIDVFTKVSTGGEASPVFSFALWGPSEAKAMVYRGVGSIGNVSATANNLNGPQSFPMAGLTALANSTVVSFAGQDNPVAASMSGAGFTQREATAGTYFGMACGDQIGVSAGTNPQVTATTAGTNPFWCGAAIELRP